MVCFMHYTNTFLHNFLISNFDYTKCNNYTFHLVLIITSYTFGNNLAK